jgi:hypothetical protein
MMKPFALTAAFVVALHGLSATATAEDLNCLNKSERKQAALYSHLQQQAYTALDRRREVYEQLETPEQIRAYQQRLREFFVKQLGGFPERTPLNARTVGTIEADGYRIEKVIYDSQPHHRITANFYLPDGDGPFPGVVVSSGHSRTAKTADYNQRFGIMMARTGMAALCFDPIGQGERSQILNAEGKNRFKDTTTEHFLVGVGSILVGRSTARYRVWDAMRSIDAFRGLLSEGEGRSTARAPGRRRPGGDRRVARRRVESRVIRFGYPARHASRLVFRRRTTNSRRTYRQHDSRGTRAVRLARLGSLGRQGEGGVRIVFSTTG